LLGAVCTALVDALLCPALCMPPHCRADAHNTGRVRVRASARL